MPTLIEAQIRIPEGKNANRRIRLAGKIPAIVYGQIEQPTALSLDPDDIKAILRSEAGRNTIFTVNIEGAGQHSVMVKEYQLDPVKGKLLHVDLMKIAMDRLLTLTVNIELIGTPYGVKNEGGMLDFVTRTIEIECMPADIPESVKLEVGELRVGDYIRAKNINLGDKVRILTEPEVVIATIAASKKGAATSETTDVAAEPEVAKKGKTE